jgi:anthranilate synthase component 2
MRILLIDNYDSFTYNLLHLIKKKCDGTDEVNVVFNDQIDSSEARNYDFIIISPGPGVPSEAGNLLNIITELSPYKSILGICLGHQAIAETFGARIYCCDKPLHGAQTNIEIIDNSLLFRGLDKCIQVGRYHSWLVDKNSIPDSLKVTAMDNNGEIMAISHTRYDVHGIQFHPESFMTDKGDQMIQNFLNRR